MPELLLQFRKFVDAVAADTPERTIDHGYGWSECAVGDFFVEQLRVDDKSEIFTKFDQVVGHNTALNNFLGGSDTTFPQESVPTYGDLAVALRLFDDKGMLINEEAARVASMDA